MNIKTMQEDNHIDDHVDVEINQCFNKKAPKSFFTFAGAGSGKTRSLINALTYIDNNMGEELMAFSQQVAVITYTNAACDEISRRMQYKSIFAISTIHAFLWEQIKNFQIDIKDWVKAKILDEIKDLEEGIAKGRTEAARKKREDKICKNRERFSRIENVRKFSYNPNGENFGYDALNHAEVVKMAVDFIVSNETMQKIIINKYPIMLIDESQDTKKELVDALLLIYEKYKDNITIGMFGDTMQRIYLDGKENLSSQIPDEWKKTEKCMNHRSSVRIVQLANDIRSTIDNQQQKPRSDAKQGYVRLFLADKDSDKSVIEQKVLEKMAEESDDTDWLCPGQCKSLILEHHMAANRLGFADLYYPLKDISVFDNALLDGTLPELSFLANIIRPLVSAYKADDEFEVARIIRQSSPLLDKKVFKQTFENQSNLIEIAEQKVDEVLSLWAEERTPNCLDIFLSIKKSGLFNVSDRINEVLSNPLEESIDPKITALRKSLLAPFTQLEQYADYVGGNTQFATQQGIKGLEFPRVAVIIDDAEAKGFLFNYEKLFGVSSKTETDLKNERDGKDTGIARTTRLFYVACTRAQQSLAVIVYTGDKEIAKRTAVEKKWFKCNEIIIFDEAKK